MTFDTSFLHILVYGFLSLFPMVNPFSTVPLFLSLTPDDSAFRNRVARQAALNTFIVLTVCMLAGTLVLQFFSISISALRCAGGIIILIIGLKMLLFDPNVEHQHEPRRDIPDPSFVPLTIPSLAGAGSMSVAIQGSAYVHKLPTVFDQIMGYAAGALVGVAIALSTWAILRLAVPMAMLLGRSGMVTLQKVMGFLLTCIGVQFLQNGIADFVKETWRNS